MKKLYKNPVFIIVFLTSLMGLPFLVFLMDKYLLNLSEPVLFLAELSIITMGITSATIILLFFFKK
ncbi:hypothetical protein [Sulfurihydrogenibium subterraneum]|uniref:hypothetical protein n=1 Tax=Sulfurihydrogenibium subterraneum TaxID=171121 RepID=UPI00048DE515|nr:hypothetical protein [Sulfurihydrogenibium subterraneum]